MSDVFISYAREDRDRAGELASALGALGWSVWWDRNIVTGQVFDQAIERELEAAKSVVVLWSKHSVASEWVKSEAASAAERGVLVPALLDGVRPPLEFRRRQTADLTGWRGEPAHGGFQALCEGIAAATDSLPTPRPIPRRPETSPSSARRRRAALAVLVVAVGFGVYATREWLRDTRPDRTGTDASSESRQPLAGPADLVAGVYDGEVVADAQGGSRSDVVVTITRLDRSTVRVTSDYGRLGTVDVTLTRSGNQVVHAGGDTGFTVDLDQHPPALLFNPHGEVAYQGKKRQ